MTDTLCCSKNGRHYSTQPAAGLDLPTLMTRTSPSLRLFFALLPGPAEQRAIARHAAQLSPDAGSKVRPENWHLTLHFLGAVPQERVEALCLDVDTLALPAFAFTVDRCHWWEKAGIFWLGPAEAPATLLELARRLSTIAARRQLTMEKHRYVPHLTLLRKVHSAPQGILVEPFTWEAREFWLMQSETKPGGVQYHKLASWPLLP